MLKWIGRILLPIMALIGFAGLWLYQSDIPRAELTARYANGQSRFVTLMSGAVAHYRDEGPREAPVLLLLHGSNASLHTWEPWVERLSGPFRVISVDLPGHGLTGAVPRGGYDQKAMAAFVFEFAAALELKGFAIAGNSMGGGVAGRFVIDNPGIATHLILVDASGFPSKVERDPGLGFRLARMPVAQNLLRWIAPRAIYADGLRTAIVHDALVTDAMIDRYWLLNRMEGTRDATLARFQAADDDTIRRRAGEIAVPTLILWGDKDTLIPPDAGEAWAAAVRGSKLIVYPGIGHVPMEEDPDKTASDVAAFLAAP